MLTVFLNSAFSSAMAGLARLVTAGATIMRNRAALKSLRELDERTLADIGLTRGDVITAASQPLHKDPMLIDPFDAKRRIHARELEVLARWARPEIEERQPLPAEKLTAIEQTPVCCGSEGA
ncbi:DUF1127 domain-containing protein [uncultured Cohaesibacter sp.]|uniref:DUF1127 domain-containing protein n=1 Tax=uncultured Cohaesibacter sp. TaxID=1002546 RepID=UPI002AAC3037|nr:DUF1127 domain-containing protein [uncultured Cohaesibacter sp.]